MEVATQEGAIAEAPKKTRAPRVKPEPKSVSLSAIKAMLDAGKTRKEIKQELGLAKNQADELFNNPKIKGYKRAYTKESFKAPITITDDLPEVEEAVSEGTDTTNEAPAPAPETPAPVASTSGPATDW